MREDRNNKEYIEAVFFFDNLIEFISECSDQSTGEIKNDLEQEGIDIDGIIGRVKRTIDETLTRERLKWQTEAAKENKNLIDRLKEIPHDLIDSLSIGEVRAQIQGLLESAGQEYAFQYRNLEKGKEMSAEELRETLKDLIVLIKANDELSDEVE